MITFGTLMAAFSGFFLLLIADNEKGFARWVFGTLGFLAVAAATFNFIAMALGFHS